MKYKKLIIYLLLISLTLACGCSSQQQRQSIAVIVKATDSDFWQSVRRGVNAAATEYNISVTFEGPENEEDYLKQNELINRAVQNGANAIVFSAIDYYQSANAISAAANAGVQIVVIDSGVNSDKINTFIGTDNYKAGQAAAAAAVECRGRSENMRIGIVNYDRNTDNGRQRESGFRDYISALPEAEVVEAVNVDSNTTSATAGAISLLHAHPEINVLVGFNEWMTLGIGNAIQQLGLKDTVTAVGFDNNVISVSMLETGEMDALIVQNPFAMGYLGVQSAADLISGRSVPDNIETSATTITKQNMFDEDSQKILFRFE